MSIENKTILITGATDGLGKEVAKRCAAAGARVLLHGRDAAKGEAVKAEIAAATGSDKLEVFTADLASLGEVRALAKAIQAKHDRIDVLLNNAGIGLFAPGEARRESRDGHELHFAVNYLAPYLLTRLLLPQIEAAAPSRIVNVASIGQAPVDFEDLEMTQGYSGFEAYRRSKLAQILFTFDLAERLKGTGVTVTALHPATLMATNMVTGSGMPARSTIDDGAAPTFRLVASDEVEGESGLYYDQFKPARASDQAYDPDARARLWVVSAQLVSLPVND